MRIGHRGGGDRNRRRVEAPGSKFKYRLNLLPRHVVLLDDFLNAGAQFQILKNSSDGHPRIPKYPCAAPPVRHAFDGGAP